MIDILLASYNGEEYIGELLQSLENQSFKEWRLIAADDRSTDRTLEILRQFAASSSHEVEIHVNQLPTGSAKANFFSMFQYVRSPYVMLCDQDDVWLERKIEKTMDAMNEMETSCGASVPILVHSDLRVVDRDLGTIEESFFRYSNYKNSFSLREQLALNKVTGCTVMFNRALLEYLLNREFDTSKIQMHDSWLALIARCFGKVRFVDEGLILYRQHGVNSVGAQNARSLRYILKKIGSFKDNSYSNLGHIIEVEYFCEVYGQLLADTPYRDLLLGYASLREGSRGAYRRYCLKNRILKEPFTRAAAQLLFAQR